jgi:hypothetical protein
MFFFSSATQEDLDYDRVEEELEQEQERKDLLRQFKAKYEEAAASLHSSPLPPEKPVIPHIPPKNKDATVPPALGSESKKLSDPKPVSPTPPSANQSKTPAIPHIPPNIDTPSTDDHTSPEPVESEFHLPTSDPFIEQIALGTQKPAPLPKKAAA